MLLGLALALSVGGTNMDNTTFLSDVGDRMVYVQQGWGELGLDECAHAPGVKALPLQIGEKVYRKGLGSHAPGVIVVDLDEAFLSFDALVGVEKQDSNIGSVIFQVFVDEKKLFESPVMRQADAPISVHVDLKGAKVMRLVATDAGDGITGDCANWAEARLTADPTAKPRPLEQFDLAPFAQVCTWDPNRMDGARASRIEEFHEEDVYLDRPAARSGAFGYKTPTNGCIGLVWDSRRKPTSLGLAVAGIGEIDTSKVQVQAWASIYPFQGEWKPLAGIVERDNKGLTFLVGKEGNAEFAQGFRKVRWVLPSGAKLGPTCKLSAKVATRLRTASLRIETEAKAGDTFTIGYVNCEPTGVLPAKSRTGEPRTWDVRYPVTADWDDGPTQPKLRVSLGKRTFTVNLKDVLGGGVYVAETGLFVSKPGDTLVAYKRRFADKMTVLERVRNMPDQTFVGAMERTYRDTHFGSPTLLSVGADNWKWLVETYGAIRWEPEEEVADRQMPFERRRCVVDVKVNGECLAPVRERALGQGMKLWMPFVQQRQGPCTFNAIVAPMAGSRGLFVGEYVLDGSEAVDMTLTFFNDHPKGLPAELTLQGSRVLVKEGDRLMAVVDLAGVTNLEATVDGGTLRFSGAGTGTVKLAIPGWKAGATDNDLQRIDVPSLRMAFVDYWNAFAAEGMQIEVPDPLLSDIIQSSRVRCLVDSRNRDGGAKIAPWIAEIHYGPLESEANTIIRGMALMGHKAFAEKCFDYFISLYAPAGFLTTGYTVVGTGWHLWTLGEAFELQPDGVWLKRHADDVARACRWVVAQRRKTMKKLVGVKPPQYGLFTPGVIADWNAFQYYFYSNGTYCAGLETAGRALKAIGHPEADGFIREAKSYRADIVEAYRRTQELTPVVPLQDGTWVAGQPSQVHCPGPLGGYYPGDDGSRSWCYDVELGSHNLVQQGVLPPDGRDSFEQSNYAEDHWYLRDGWGDYPAAESHEKWFDLGGFAKVQPYYARMQEIYAMRDDVKPYVRGYFNMIASLVDPSNLTIWEHFGHYGAPDKTHETGVFLQQTRFMLVKERGEELWLAPMVTDNWLKDGMAFGVKHAPTFFGDVSYRVVSHVGSGTIEAEIDPPQRRAPKAIVLRLRHPEGLKMKSVTVNGKAWKAFDAAKEVVRLKPTTGKVTVRATY